MSKIKLTYQPLYLRDKFRICRRLVRWVALLYGGNKQNSTGEISFLKTMIQKAKNWKIWREKWMGLKNGK